MSNILVTGATGQLGKTVVNGLRNRTEAGKIAALVRDATQAHELLAAGVNAIWGDYNNYESLIAAFAGIDRLYFVSSSDLVHRRVQHENVVKAAIKAGVGHIFYTSGQRKSEDGSSPIAYVADAHWQTEDLIRSSGLNFTILKHNLYADVVPMFAGETVLTTGIYLPAGEGRTAYASRADMAEAGAILLTTDGHENKTYNISGGVSYSFGDIADMLSELSGKKVNYTSPPVEEFIEILRTYNIADEQIRGAATFAQAIEQGEFDFPSSELKNLLGREPQTLKAFLKSAYQL